MKEMTEGEATLLAVRWFDKANMKVQQVAGLVRFLATEGLVGIKDEPTLLEAAKRAQHFCSCGHKELLRDAIAREEGV